MIDGIKISLIAAVADNGVIGNKDKLPWYIKSELQYFKKTTTGKPIVMGRKSFESLGKPLTDRLNIVVTRKENYKAESTVIAPSLDVALGIAKEESLKKNVEEIFIGGGAEIYKQMLDMADRIYLTEVHMMPEGDTFFPAFDRSMWREIKREKVMQKENEPAAYTITVLERK